VLTHGGSPGCTFGVAGRALSGKAGWSMVQQVLMVVGQLAASVAVIVGGNR
jgi:hypothetical protein